MPESVEWFPRFGDIPGVTYERAPGIDASGLPGFGAVPELTSYEFDGERHESLWWSWEGEEGTTSASPVQMYKVSGDDVVGLLTSLHGGLELPGRAGDYHYLIQGTAEPLLKLSREDPSALAEMERLCWLDVELIEAKPDSIRDEYRDGPSYYRVVSFGLLIGLYKGEGCLHEALAVADRAVQFGQGTEEREELVARIAVVENETSGVTS